MTWVRFPATASTFVWGPVRLSTPALDALEDPQEGYSMPVSGTHVGHPHPDGLLPRVRRDTRMLDTRTEWVASLGTVPSAGHSSYVCGLLLNEKENQDY